MNVWTNQYLQNSNKAGYYALNLLSTSSWLILKSPILSGCFIAHPIKLLSVIKACKIFSTAMYSDKN